MKLKEKGRVCKHGGCGTILSVYNSMEYCNVHRRDGEKHSNVVTRKKGKMNERI